MFHPRLVVPRDLCLALAASVSEFRQHSYIRRRGRLTKAQARALDEHTPSHAATLQEISQLAASKPVGIEIGFGMGHALLRWAASEPSWELLGVELYQPGIGALSDGLQREGLTNVRVLEYPAQEVIAALPAVSVDEVRIFFPDPWPKKRHHKRRLIQPDFLVALAQVMKPAGRVRLATDWLPYAQWIRECFAACTEFSCCADHIRKAGSASAEETLRGITNFERRGERLGHDITDFEYQRR